MLNRIFVKDLAIVRSLELELASGLTALTGETGAGKSILIDALGLALGDKADTGLIRAGCDCAEVVADFDLAGLPLVRAWLAEQQLEAGGECLVRRRLVRNGRSRAYINAHPATAAQLQALGERLVDIHGQHAHQSLLRPAAQRDLLDAYAGLTREAAEVARCFHHFQDLARRLDSARTQSAERQARRALLDFQVQELAALALSTNELEILDREQRRLAHLGQLQETSGRLLDQLYESDSSLHDTLSRAGIELGELTAIEPALEEVRELLEGATIQIGEAAASLRHYLESLELDPALAEQVEARLSRIHDLARKYRVLPARLPALLEQWQEEIERLRAAEESQETLIAERDAAEAAFLSAAQTLSARRAPAARRLAQTVTASMQELGMNGGCFEVDCRTGAGSGAHGLDRIAFQVSANPGQPLQPLARVVSGGELSRISLGIQVAAAECAQVPVLIFDEVDVGIGGAVAEIVGRLLRTLGASRQVLCVTHLPQVAAQAHHHLRVHKQRRAGQTYTDIESLEARARVQEIARMLAGMEITDKTLAHAQEMVSRNGR